MGVCLSTGGPGATHMSTGLYDAMQDHQPVLAIMGQAPRAVRGWATGSRRSAAGASWCRKRLIIESDFD